MTAPDRLIDALPALAVVAAFPCMLALLAWAVWDFVGRDYAAEMKAIQARLREIEAERIERIERGKA